MKKCVLAVLAVAMIFSLSIFGCAKKESADEYQEAMAIDTLGGPGTLAQPQAQKAAEPKAASIIPAATSGASAKLEALPPSGPYKPSIRDIQTALKNAGYYAGEVDGKSGKMTKKAIEDFQKANSLEADGKVGPKTWTALSTYLTAAPAPAGKN